MTKRGPFPFLDESADFSELFVSTPKTEAAVGWASPHLGVQRESSMADANECRRQAAECRRLSRTDVDPGLATILQTMGNSWTALANQMDRLIEANPSIGAQLALAR